MGNKNRFQMQKATPPAQHKQRLYDEELASLREQVNTLKLENQRLHDNAQITASGLRGAFDGALAKAIEQRDEYSAQVRTLQEIVRQYVPLLAIVERVNPPQKEGSVYVRFMDGEAWDVEAILTAKSVKQSQTIHFPPVRFVGTFEELQQEAGYIPSLLSRAPLKQDIVRVGNTGNVSDEMFLTYCRDIAIFYNAKEQAEPGKLKQIMDMAFEQVIWQPLRQSENTPQAERTALKDAITKSAHATFDRMKSRGRGVGRRQLVAGRNRKRD